MDTAFFRFTFIALVVSLTAQLICFTADLSPELGLWFGGLAGLLLVGIGVAMFLRFRFSEWLIDASAIAVGLLGGLS